MKRQMKPGAAFEFRIDVAGITRAMEDARR